MTHTPVLRGLTLEHAQPLKEHTLSTQPTHPLPSAAAIPTQRDQAGPIQLRRLVSTWQSVAGAMVCAEAHNRDESSLMTQLGHVESLIQSTYPIAWASLEPALLAAVLRWSHDGLPATSAMCLLCRRVSSGLPLDLPLPILRSAR